MSKPYFSIVFKVFIFILLPLISFGHTINQHLEELYGELYLPLFIIAELLPFIGLGTLAFNPASSRKQFQVKWPFLISLCSGLILGLIVREGDFTLIVNKIAILACGFLLLFAGESFSAKINFLFILLGITIGFENGLYIIQASEFMWLFISIFFSGILIFLFLNNIQLIGQPKRKMIQFAMALILILSGVVLILLT